MIGIDIVKISRISRLVEKERFLNRVFSTKEIEYFKEKGMNLETISGSFAAKEAVSKAFGTGIGKLSFKDIEIIRDNTGKPSCLLSEKGLKLANDLGISEVMISISHEKEYAVAIANAVEDDMPLEIDISDLPILKKRENNSHKGDYGKVGLIGGSNGMTGSILLSSMAALRTGAGLVYTVVPESLSEIVEIKSLENIVVPIPEKGEGNFDINSLQKLKEVVSKYDAICFGPGVGRSDDIGMVLSNLLQMKKKTVLDADGLNALAENPEILEDTCDLCITPHAVEMSRLINKDIDYINENRLDVAMSFSKLYNVIVVLKGHETIVTNGESYYINKTGNPGMATAGSGDVLTGIITALAAGGYDLFEAAKLGVFLHGLAGDYAAIKHGQDSLIARDIIDSLGSAIQKKRFLDARNNYSSNLGRD